MPSIANMVIQRAYKTELDVNNAQASTLRQFAGASRWVYNWGLSQHRARYESGEKKLSSKQLDKVLREQQANIAPWLSEAPSHVRQSALADLDKAYTNFFRRLKTGEKPGFPKYKSRKNGIGSFRVYFVTINDRRIRIPKLGWIRLKERGYIPSGCYGDKQARQRIISTTISERAGRWYVAVQVEETIEEPVHAKCHAVGVDFGVSTLATTSDELFFTNPKALKRTERKLRRLQKAVSRKEKGSANRRKAVSKLATAHARVAAIRTHTLHHVSHVLTRKSSIIALENLNVKGMMSNHHLAGAIADSGFGTMRHLMEYKSEWRGCRLIVCDRWLPSSKLCSVCGEMNYNLTLSQRWWVCDCGVRHNRDVNAAINLRNVAVSQTESLNACGGEGSGLVVSSGETNLSEAGSGQPTLGIGPAAAENGGISMHIIGNGRGDSFKCH